MRLLNTLENWKDLLPDEMRTCSRCSDMTSHSSEKQDSLWNFNPVIHNSWPSFQAQRRETMLCGLTFYISLISQYSWENGRDTLLRDTQLPTNSPPSSGLYPVTDWRENVWRLSGHTSSISCDADCRGYAIPEYCSIRSNASVSWIHQSWNLF